MDCVNLEDGEGQLEEICRQEDDHQLSDDVISIKEQNGNVVNEDDDDDDEEEEKEEVKQISSEINQASNNMSRFSLEYAEMLPEFESLLSGEIDLPYSTNQFDIDRNDESQKLDREYQNEMENNANELQRLRSLVKELEEREVKLEGELLEYYGLKEQESDIVELQRQLKIKSVEIDMLNITINSLQSERKKLNDEIAQVAVAKKELDAARNKIKELQRQMQLQANQTKSQLLLLKQQVTGLQSKEEEAAKTDSDIGKKLKAVKELEVEVVELKRKNKELQHEKRELIVKLDSAEAKVKELSTMTEVKIIIIIIIYGPIRSAAFKVFSFLRFSHLIFPMFTE